MSKVNAEVFTFFPIYTVPEALYRSHTGWIASSRTPHDSTFHPHYPVLG